MSEWRKTAKTVLVTAAVTSVAWLAAGAFLLQRYQMAPSTAHEPLIEAQRTVTPQSAPGAKRSQPAGVATPISGERLMIPVEGIGAGQLVDTFTQARADGARVHDAIDILAPRGTPVLAAAPGRIEKLFLSKPGGKTIYERSDDGRSIYYYAHLDAYAPGLAEGQRVQTGQRLATVGSTGNADPAAPHLHFAIQRTTPGAKWWEPSTPINPYPLLTRK